MSAYFDLMVDLARVRAASEGWLIRAPWGAYLELNPHDGVYRWSAGLVIHATVFTREDAERLQGEIPEGEIVRDGLGRMPEVLKEKVKV